MRLARTAVLVTALALLTGCASSTGGTDDTIPPLDETETAVTDLSGDWLLVKGTDAQGSMALDLVSITLAIQQDGTVSGQAPCNSYTGALEQDASSVTFGPLASTLMACVDDTKTALETRYLAALESVASARLGGEILDLSGDGVSLRYELTPKKSTQ
ncbi:heat shock protein HslJ [Conyzicola lurida]|uniref:Heat shock protein HslJ n=1 Tax=Conyzicola lurida TaxID=1172621 RepID=A0A841AIT8_9MICO|nr:heat shock protein HslJ [Conyzicola lurida]